MSFSLTTLILVSFGYLLLLFGIAHITERGIIPKRWVRHPVVYVLSLGVYAGTCGRVRLRLYCLLHRHQWRLPARAGIA